MQEWLDTGLSDLGIDRNIANGVEHLRRLSPLEAPGFEIMQQRVYVGLRDVGIAAQVVISVEDAG